MKWACLILCSLLLNCSGERNLENPEGLLNKSQFDKEWYFRASLVGKQSHNAFGFTGMECPIERVKFEVGKDKLFAYRSYENGMPDDKVKKDNVLVAAFPIIPQMNEDYVMVDWSQNLVPHLECNKWLQTITMANISSPGNGQVVDPHRVRIQDSYMESTVDALVQADEKTCQELSEWNCLPAEVRVKFSFKKVKEGNDYQAMHYPDAEPIRYGLNKDSYCLEGEQGCDKVKELWLYSDAQRSIKICDPFKDALENCALQQIKLNAQFGFFRTPLQVYDHQEGYTRKELRQLINRWNIWDKSRENGQKIIPIQDRTPKKIVYYLNPGVSPALKASIEKIAQQWNVAFANVVAKVKNKCTLENAALAVRENNLKAAAIEKGITNILPENLKDICSLAYQATKNKKEADVFFTGDPAEVLEKYGDLFEIRQNDCNKEKVQNYQITHDLSEVLIEHGLSEINDENVELACSVLEWHSKKNNIEPQFHWQQIGDLRFSFLNVITKPENVGLLGYGPAGVDPKTGEIISGNANIYLAAITKMAYDSVLLLENVEKIRAQTVGKNEKDESRKIEDLSHLIGKTLSLMSEETFQSVKTTNFLQDNLAKLGEMNLFPSFNGSAFMLSSLAKDARPMEQIFSLISAQNSDFFAAKTRHKQMMSEQEFFSERSACFLHASHELPYLEIQEKMMGMSFSEKVEYLKLRIFEGVATHELGHTFGLRHNFKGGKDPLNFPPNFWNVDTNDYRMRNGLSKEELRSSSIMEYHKRFNANFSGVGLYDYAALLAGYGEKIEVFDDSDSDFTKSGLLQKLSLMNYQDFPALFSEGNATKIYQHMHKKIDAYRQGDKGAHMDLASLHLTENPQNMFKRKFVDFAVLRKQVIDDIFGQKSAGFVPVPYEFCTDDQTRRGDVACQPYLSGSSASEIVENAIKDFEMARQMELAGSKIFTSHAISYLNGVYAHVYQPILRSYQKMYALGAGEIRIFPSIYDLTKSTHIGLEFISRVLQSVNPGHYCKDEEGNYIPKASDKTCKDEIFIEDKNAKPFHSQPSASLKGLPNELGTFYDKMMALLVLIDDQTFLEHEFSSWQKRNASIGFYRLFAPQLINVFTSLYMNKWENWAPDILVGPDRKIEIRYKNLFEVPARDQTVIQPKIMPSSSSILREYAIIFAMAGLSNHSDQKLDFAKRSQISVVANDYAGDGNALMDEIIFRDPNTGISYRAVTKKNEALSPGYLLLKDAYNFVYDGSNTTQPEGPWHKAYASFKRAQTQTHKVRAGLGSTASAEDLVKSETDLHQAQSELEEKNLVLREKVRAIDMVKKLSDRLNT